MNVIEFHKDKGTIKESAELWAEWAQQESKQRQEAAEAYCSGNGWTGDVRVDAVVPPEVRHVVLPKFDVNRFHDEVLAAGLHPALVESDPDGAWMRLTFEYGFDA